LPPAAYYLRPIDEESLETKKWLVRRSRRALVGGLAEPSREGKGTRSAAGRRPRDSAGLRRAADECKVIEIRNIPRKSYRQPGAIYSLFAKQVVTKFGKTMCDIVRPVPERTLLLAIVARGVLDLSPAYL